MVLRSFVAVVAVFGLAGCVVTSAPPPSPEVQTGGATGGPEVSREVAARNFTTAVARVEPVAERMCAQRLPGGNCDFLIEVDTRRNVPPNAFQTLNRAGRPVLVFTVGLIEQARNADEIAFVIGHEAAHHIEQHIPQQQEQAVTSAVAAGILATILGGNQAVVNQAAQAGAEVGARRFSKDHELEADALGTVIAHRAGFDPVKGAAFFARIPDPGDQFLGTHPPNAARVATVRRVAAGL